MTSDIMIITITLHVDAYKDNNLSNSFDGDDDDDGYGMLIYNKVMMTCYWLWQRCQQLVMMTIAFKFTFWWLSLVRCFVTIHVFTDVRVTDVIVTAINNFIVIITAIRVIIIIIIILIIMFSALVVGFLQIWIMLKKFLRW